MVSDKLELIPNFRWWLERKCGFLGVAVPNAGDARIAGSIPGSGRSPGGGNGSLFQYPRLENPVDRGSLAGYSPWGRKESDTTEHTHTQRGICPETNERGVNSCY